MTFTPSVTNRWSGHCRLSYSAKAAAHESLIYNYTNTFIGQHSAQCAHNKEYKMTIHLAAPLLSSAREMVPFPSLSSFFINISYLLHFLNQHSFKNIFNGNFIIQELNNSIRQFYHMANYNCLAEH